MIAVELRQWLRELVQSGMKQNVVWQRPALTFQKRLKVDVVKKEGGSELFPACPSHLRRWFTDYVNTQSAMSLFDVDFESGSAKSLLIKVSKQAFEQYLAHCILTEFAYKRRVDATVTGWVNELLKRDYDLPGSLPHWRSCQALLRALEGYQELTLPVYVRNKVGKALVPLRIHKDKKVAEDATKMLRKFKKLHDEHKAVEGEKRSQAQAVEEQIQAELEELF